MDNPREEENPEMKTLVERRDFLGGAATLAGTSLLGLGLPASAEAAGKPRTPIDATHSGENMMPPTLAPL